MKNLLIYISPTGSLNNPNGLTANDASGLVKVQIENSLQLGWKPEDIILITSFDFQYGVIKATVLPDIEYFESDPRASKINAIVKMFEKGLIKGNELYWFHDLDAFQLAPITESELRLGKADMALTDYDVPSRWNTASLFFKKSSKDIFYLIKKIVYRYKIGEEYALNKLTDKDKDIRKRIKKINRTYNFAPYSKKPCYKNLKIRPIRVVHFHPLWWSPSRFILIIPDRLIKIFHYHRIR